MNFKTEGETRRFSEDFSAFFILYDFLHLLRCIYKARFLSVGKFLDIMESSKKPSKIGASGIFGGT